jgi:hypothetical protein
MKLFKVSVTMIILLTIKTAFSQNPPKNALPELKELEECTQLSTKYPFNNLEDKRHKYLFLQKACWSYSLFCAKYSHKMRKLHDELAKNGSPFVKCYLNAQDESLKDLNVQDLKNRLSIMPPENRTR